LPLVHEQSWRLTRMTRSVDLLDVVGPVRIKNAAHGTYLGMHPGNGSRVFATDTPRAWEEFNVIVHGDESVSFQSVAHNNYLGVESDGSKAYGAVKLNWWEMFKVEKTGGGFHLKSKAHGTAIGADGDRVFVADNASWWEVWRLEDQHVDDLTDVEFFTDRATILSSKPICCKEVIVNNKNGKADQWSLLVYTEQVTQTKSTTHNIGFNYSTTTSFKGGFKLVEASCDVSLSFSHGHSWTDSEAVSKSTSINVNVNAKPGEKIRAKAMCHQANVSTPYVMKFASGRRVTGVWTGVAHSTVTVEYDDLSSDA